VISLGLFQFIFLVLSYEFFQADRECLLDFRPIPRSGLNAGFVFTFDGHGQIRVKTSRVLLIFYQNQIVSRPRGSVGVGLPSLNSKAFLSRRDIGAVGLNRGNNSMLPCR
jgi:hypothetical protein